MESIIKDHMLTFLNANNLISVNQHGFTPNKSTFTLLVECVHDWTSAVESRSPVHVTYIDFKKHLTLSPIRNCCTSLIVWASLIN